MKLYYVFLPLIGFFLLSFGLLSLVNPTKMQEILFRFGMNKIQNEIMGEKAHLIFLRILGAVLTGVAVLLLSTWIKMLRS